MGIGFFIQFFPWLGMWCIAMESGTERHWFDAYLWNSRIRRHQTHRHMFRGTSSFQDFEGLLNIFFQLKSLYVAITRARNNLRIADFSTKGEPMRVCLLHSSYFFSSYKCLSILATLVEPRSDTKLPTWRWDFRFCSNFLEGWLGSESDGFLRPPAIRPS